MTLDSFKFKQLLFYVFSIVFFAFFGYNVFSLATGRYKILPERLFKLDTITLQSKAYLLTGNNKSTFIGYDFQDTTWQSYRIDDAQYHALVDPNFISDTLQYHGTRLIVYTDKEGMELFQNKNKSQKIYVYQLSIGGKDYIDISKLNKQARSSIVLSLILFACFYLLGLAYYFKKRGTYKKRTTTDFQNQDQ